MSFEIGGITFYEPTDYSLVALASVQGVLAYDGDYVRRVAKSAFSLPGHDHDNDVLRPGNVYPPDAGTQLIVGEPPCYIRFYVPTGGIHLYGTNVTVVPSASYSAFIVDKVAGGAYSFRLDGTPGTRNGIADGWYEHPSSIDLKSNVQPITNALARLELADGITYEQDGLPGAGISAEDLEQLGLPGLTHKNELGIYDGINKTGCIPMLLEGIKELSASVALLTSRVAALENIS